MSDKIPEQMNDPPNIPTLAECQDYAKELGQIEAYGTKFFLHYEADDWFYEKQLGKKIVKRPIKNWRNKMRQWVENDKIKEAQRNGGKNKQHGNAANAESVANAENKYLAILENR